MTHLPSLSDLYTVSSLLVQKLIKLIRHAFITPDGNNTKPNVGVYNVLQFLKQDINCYLMLTLSLVCHKVCTPCHPTCGDYTCTHTGHCLLPGASRAGVGDTEECLVYNHGLHAELWYVNYQL